MLSFSTISSGFSSLVAWSCEINNGGDYNFNSLTQHFGLDSNVITGFLCDTIAKLEEYSVPKETAALIIGVPTLGLMMYKAYKKCRGEKAETFQSLLSSAIKGALGPVASDVITTYIKATIGDELEATAEAQLKALPEYHQLGDVARTAIKGLMVDNLVRAIKPELTSKSKEISELAKQNAKQKKTKGVVSGPVHNHAEPAWVGGVKGILRPLSQERCPAVKP